MSDKYLLKCSVCADVFDVCGHVDGGLVALTKLRDDLRAQLAAAVETVGMLERDNADLHEKLAAAERYRDNANEACAAALKLHAAAESRNARLVELLRRVEHVWLPGMPLADRRCPVCRSPFDLSQPHEVWCALAAELKEGSAP